MKKFFKIFAIAAATLFTVATVSAFTEPAEPEVTINLSGFENPMYMSLNSCEAIFNLLPGDIQYAAKAAYKDVTKLGNDSSMNYAGVSVSHREDSWTFKYAGNKVTVNATMGEMNEVFDLQ